MSRKELMIAVLTTMLGIVGPTAQAEFALNFQPSGEAFISGTDSNKDCRDRTIDAVNGPCIRRTNLIDADRSPFYQELITTAEGDYYHVIVGDPGSEFALEYYIQAFRVFGVGWFRQYANPYNASVGSIYNGGEDMFGVADSSPLIVDPLSATDPVNALRGSGNGTGNPKRVIFHQLLSDPEMSMEIVKATYQGKPTISQTLTAGGLDHNFILDMSSIDYNDSSTAGVLTNQFTITDPDMVPPVAEFDAVSNAQKSNITGGKYTFLNGPEIGGAYGTYNYSDGAYDLYGTNWLEYSDPTVNVPNTLP